MYPRILSLALVILSLALVGPASAISAPATGRSEVSLNGIWDFYPEGGTNRFDIRVPSFWDAPQDYNYPKNWAYLRHGVYRKSFAVPPAMRDQLIYLNIERVSVIAKVFVNGTQVGGEDANGYLMMQLPYDLDITKLVKLDGPNQLEVQVWGGKSMVHGDDSQDKLIGAIAQLRTAKVKSTSTWEAPLRARWMNSASATPMLTSPRTSPPVRRRSSS